MGIIKELKKRVMKKSRNRKLEQFYSRYEGGKVLDVGVSGAVRIEGENVFLETFRGGDADYTGLGVEDLAAIQARHPGKALVTYEGRDFPFEDRSFEWVFSNAVIEHVGDEAAQVHFVNEMLRVSRRVYFTTPNKYFPVESHTNALLLHWFPGDVFYRWCAKNRPYWNKSNLNLLGLRRLQRIMVASNATKYRIISNRLMGWPMTYSVLCGDRID